MRTTFSLIILKELTILDSKLVGMIGKEQFEMLEETHPFFGIKKVLTNLRFNENYVLSYNSEKN